MMMDVEALVAQVHELLQRQGLSFGTLTLRDKLDDASVAVCKDTRIDASRGVPLTSAEAWRTDKACFLTTFDPNA
jgi:hypothetical protein